MSANVKGTPKIPKNKVRSQGAIAQDEHEDRCDAKRVIMINSENCEPVDSSNPFPVEIVGVVPDIPSNLHVQLTHLDDDPLVGDIHDSVRIGDGVDLLAICPDGSINVNIVSGCGLPTTLKSIYGEITSLPPSTLSLVTSYVVPVAKTAELKRVQMSGENIATYTLFLNGSKLDRRRTYFGADLNAEMDFRTQGEAIKLIAGDLLELKVEHSRPVSFLADFNARIQVIEIG